MHVYERSAICRRFGIYSILRSHQDAIAKGNGVERREEVLATWSSISADRPLRMLTVMLSASTASLVKGGVNYILKQSHGINLPKEMREEMDIL